MALVVVTPPAIEPVTLPQVKLHARVDHNDDDGLLEQKATAARQYVERFLGRPLISTTFDLFYDAFPLGVITLPKSPVLSVTEIEYLDADGAEMSLVEGDDYTVDVASGRIAPGDAGWPSTDSVVSSVRIRFVAGYGATADEVPLPLREAVLQLAAQLYEHREAALYGQTAAPLPYGVDDILSEYREWSF
jgi:uncharacterized phiE125 gp8 family phage protein